MTNRNDFQNFDFEDFIEHPRFQRWVLKAHSQEAVFWNTFLAKYPEKKDTIADARTFLLGTKDYFDSNNLSKQEIEVKLQELLEKSPKHSHQGVKKYNLKPQKTINKLPSITRRWAVAATIALLMATLSWMWFSQTNSPQLQVFTTNYGEWESIELPDGSTVNLNANSELRFTDDWTQGEDRQVWLKGEAFFQVEKTPEATKFTVHVDDLDIEVLGTAFNVYNRGSQTEVYLEEGKVRLDMGDQEQVMAPGNLVTYSSNKQEVIEFEEVSKAQPASWKDGSLILFDQPVEIVIQKLEEIFGYEVILKNNSLFEEELTVAIPMAEIETAIPILEKILGANITLNNNQLSIE